MDHWGFLQIAFTDGHVHTAGSMVTGGGLISTLE